MALSIKSKYDDKGLWVVKLNGEIDIYTSTELKEELNMLIKDKQIDIKLDCEELDYIDSTGLGILIGILKKLKKSGNNVIIAKPKQNIIKLLKITGLDKIFIME